MDFLQNIVNQIPSPDLAVVSSIGLLLEVIFRVIPSQKPIGILVIVGKVLALLGSLFLKISALVDKIIPQNLKPQA